MAWDENKELRDEIRKLRDEIRSRDMVSIFRDAGIIILTIGLFLVAFSSSLLQVASGSQAKDFLLKSRGSGFLLILSGVFFFLASVGGLPSRDLLRVPPFKKELRMEWWFIIWMIWGMVSMAYSVLNFL